jgi:hypothetical protein
VLGRLLVESSWPVHANGVRLRGVRVIGVLDLQSARLRCPLILEGCFLDTPGPVVLDYATGTRITLLRCELPGLTADLLTLAHELDVTGSTITGTVRLSGAVITGQLSCRGARLTGTDTYGGALVADGMKAGGVFLDDGFTADGPVRLSGAVITGQLSCRGARLTGTDTYGGALVADGMKAGGVFLDGGFTADGPIRLSGADITGLLICRGAQLTGPDTDGDALVADRLKVGGDVLLDDGFTAAGTVGLRGARVGGSLTLEGAELTGPVALSAPGLQVTGELRWCPRSPVRGLVDLERAGVHRLVDDWRNPDAHWPPPGQLVLDGFTYDGFGGEHQADWRQRLGWIRRQRPANPGAAGAGMVPTQPYEQLAGVYWRNGQEAEAQEIAIAQRNDLRDAGDLTWPRWISSFVLDKTIKHGYRPPRVVGLLAALYVAVLLAFWGVQHQPGVMVPAKDTAGMTAAPTALHCRSGYPCFYPAGYALDVVVPIIKVGQAENWRPDGAAPWGWAYLAGTWLATGLGLALTALAAADYTGLVPKK